MKKSIFLSLFFIGLFFVSTPVFAQNFTSGGGTNVVSGGITNTTSGGINSYTLTNPLRFGSICGLIKALFNYILALGVPVAVLFLVYAGFRLILAGGGKGLAKAKENLINVLLGIALFIGAWVLGQVIFNTVNSLASAAGQPNVTGNSCN